MACLLVSNSPKLGTDLVIGENSETEVAIEGRVPWDVGERRERDSRQTTVCRPGADALEERSAYASALVIRPDAHLLDVRAPVNDIDEQVSDRQIHVVDGDPRPSVFRVVSERLHGGRLVVRHLGKTDVAKPDASKAFDLSKHRPFLGPRRPDDRSHASILAGRPTRLLRMQALTGSLDSDGLTS
jgi:hypothetical protein